MALTMTSVSQITLDSPSAIVSMGIDGECL